jgi:hypothetical protein
MDLGRAAAVLWLAKAFSLTNQQPNIAGRM